VLQWKRPKQRNEDKTAGDGEWLDAVLHRLLRKLVQLCDRHGGIIPGTASRSRLPATAERTIELDEGQCFTLLRTHQIQLGRVQI
jgi:hypothetical protein